MTVLLITPATVDAEQWKDRGQRTPEQAHAYAEVIRKIATSTSAFQRENVLLIDLWNADGLSSESEGIIVSDLNDGLHFGENANRKMTLKVMAAIRAHRPKLLPEEPGTLFFSSSLASLLLYRYGADSQSPPLSIHFPQWFSLTGRPPAEAIAHLTSWQWPERDT